MSSSNVFITKCTKFLNYVNLILRMYVCTCNVDLNQKTPGVKGERPRAKRPCWKRYEIGGQGLLLLIVLIIMTSLQNIVISGAQGLLMSMGSKFLIKMTRLQNIMMKEHCFVAWSSLSKFWSINIRRPWAPKITCLQWGHDDLSKAGGLGRPFWFHICFNKVF